MPRKRSKHSPIYYRNTTLVWSFAIGVFVVAVYSPTDAVAFLWLIPLIYINFLVWRLYLTTHPIRTKQSPVTPSDVTLTYEDVQLTTSDGLSLTAWYVPGKNRAAVILAHGLGGSKVHMLNQARALAFDGYGTLMIDLRAHGGSEGDTITGVKEANDILAGLNFLHSRTDVDGDKIGALGVSLGAFAVLRAARISPDIKAVTLDGLGPACLADHGGKPRSLRRKINYPINWLVYRFADWMSGETIPEGVIELVHHLWPRPIFFIAAGRGKEIHFNRLFFQAAREPKDLWEIPNAHHAAAYLYEPQEYRQRLRSFFRKSLLNE